jgi:hypothetical protein
MRECGIEVFKREKMRRVDLDKTHDDPEHSLLLCICNLRAPKTYYRTYSTVSASPRLQDAPRESDKTTSDKYWFEGQHFAVEQCNLPLSVNMKNEARRARGP